jgi:hypothetical protein
MNPAKKLQALISHASLVSNSSIYNKGGSPRRPIDRHLMLQTDDVKKVPRPHPARLCVVFARRLEKGERFAYGVERRGAGDEGVDGQLDSHGGDLLERVVRGCAVGNEVDEKLRG